MDGNIIDLAEYKWSNYDCIDINNEQLIICCTMCYGQMGTSNIALTQW